MRVDQVIAIDDGVSKFVWIDVIDPSPLELEGMSERYMLPWHAVQDCLEADHLPKFERIGEQNFVIVRTYDEAAASDADTVQELTRKIAVFESPELVITIHRRDQTFFTELKETWRTAAKLGDKIKAESVLLDIVRASIETYQKPMLLNRNLLEEFEVRVFHHAGDTFEDGYYLKRRASTFKRMIRLLMDILPRLADHYSEDLDVIQDLKEQSARLYYYAEEFYENVNQLMSLFLSLSSHRLTLSSHKQNEVMRLLTIFSVFFMPLNLITGIYGMNFEHMPELKWESGYVFVLCLLSLVSLSIGLIFWRKGYFKSENFQ